MKRDERLRYLADEIFKVSGDIKDREAEKGNLKEEFFDLVNDEFRSRDYLLPVRTVDVPNSFFDMTGMDYQEFTDTRFPGWDIEHVEKNVAEKTTTFVMKKSPALMGQVVETEVSVTSKSVVEYSPEIDWKTLKIERPDIFDKISKEITSYEIDEGQFKQALEDDPELLSVLERHMRIRKPSVKILSRKKKNDD